MPQIEYANPNCMSCRFFRPYKSLEKIGECRRKAPIGSSEIAGKTTASPIWPNVNTTDWCGEFELNRKKKKD